MAMRDVVTGGYGNGTFSPGVSKVVTRGYGIGEAIVPLAPRVTYRPLAQPIPLSPRYATAARPAIYNPSAPGPHDSYRPANPG